MMRAWSMVWVMAALSGCGASSTSPAAGHGHAHSHREGMHHRFDDVPRWSREFDDPSRDVWQQPDRVLAALALPSGAEVADVGAGTGYFAMRLARLVPEGHVQASDLEPMMVRHLADRAAAEGLTNVIAIEATEGSPQLTSPVDLVLVVNTYHHLSDRPAYFRRLRESLRPGGRVAIVDFRVDSEMGPPREHKLAPEAVEAELRDAGFALLERHDFLPEQYFLVFRSE